MIKQILLSTILVILIICALYWVKHLDRTPYDLLKQVTSPPQTIKVIKPPSPVMTSPPATLPTMAPSMTPPTSTLVPPKIYPLNINTTLTEAPNFSDRHRQESLGVETESFPPELGPLPDDDSTQRDLPESPPFPADLPPMPEDDTTQTDLPEYSKTDAESSSQLSRNVIIRSSVPKEDWEKARNLIRNMGCPVLSESENPSFSLKTLIPYERWNDFYNGLNSMNVNFTVEPTADIGSIAPDQSVEVQINVESN